MANEVSHATALSNGGRIARILAPYIHEVLYDPSGLRELMQNVPFGMGGASATTNVTKVQRGMVAAAASTEVSGGFSNTLPTTTNYDITVARYGGLISPSDLFRITGGAYDIPYILGILTEAFELTFTDLLCALFANIAGNVGTSGADMTVDDFFDAIYYLNLQLNKPDVAAVLHQQQVNDLIESLRGETGAMQFRADVDGLLRMPGVGFRGQLLGVPIYQSDSCALANASADRRGCMFAGGAFTYQLAPVAAMDPQINPADMIVSTPEMFVERDRDAPNALTAYLLNFYPGVAEAEDLRAVRITTDA